MRQVTAIPVLTESESRLAQAKFEELVANRARQATRTCDPSVEYAIHRGLFAATHGAEQVCVIPDLYTLMIVNLQVDAAGSDEPVSLTSVQTQIRRAMNLNNQIVILSGGVVPVQLAADLFETNARWAFINTSADGFDDVVKDPCEFFQIPTRHVLVCGASNQPVASAADSLAEKFPNSSIYKV